MKFATGFKHQDLSKGFVISKFPCAPDWTDNLYSAWPPTFNPNLKARDRLYHYLWENRKEKGWPVKTGVCTEGTHDLGRRNNFLFYSPAENWSVEPMLCSQGKQTNKNMPNLVSGCYYIECMT